MSLLEEQEIDCPNCGELIIVVIDLSIDEQEYIEDCSVCCSPIVLKVDQASEYNKVASFNESETT